MKKNIAIITMMCLGCFSANAQFLYAVGASGGQSFSKESWKTEQWETQEKYLEGLNLSIFAEFLDNPNFKWRSELTYNRLGTKEYVNTVQFVNKTNYLSFENYFKACLPLYSWTPYFLIGPRLSDMISRKASVFPDAIAGMSSLSLSGAVGIGIEKVNDNHIKPFLEIFYNRDLIPMYNGQVISNSPDVPPGTTIAEKIMNYDFEWRIGLKYVFQVGTRCPHVDNSAGFPPGAK